jgi:hypothetical protein
MEQREYMTELLVRILLQIYAQNWILRHRYEPNYSDTAKEFMLKTEF